MIYIFAYGSNLHLERLRLRTPSAQFIARGRLPGHELRFHKRGLDGSAKADAFFTGQCGHEIWGGVFRIARTEKPALDACESLGVGYDQAELDVLLDDGAAIKAWTYRARIEMIVQGLKPFCWYRQYVLRGAQACGLPDEYVQQIAAVAHVNDHDRRRLTQHRPLLEP